MNSPNLSSREPPLGPAHLPVVTWSNDPVQARMMSASDLADLRRWQSDPDLASVRGDALTKLTEEERDDWRQLWADVDRLLQAVAGSPAGP